MKELWVHPVGKAGHAQDRKNTNWVSASSSRTIRGQKRIQNNCYDILKAGECEPRTQPDGPTNTRNSYDHRVRNPKKTIFTRTSIEKLTVKSRPTKNESK